MTTVQTVPSSVVKLLVKNDCPLKHNVTALSIIETQLFYAVNLSWNEEPVGSESRRGSSSGAKASNERSGLSSLPTESPVISALTDKLQELNLRVERLQEAIARETSEGYSTPTFGEGFQPFRFRQQNEKRLFQLLISHKSAFTRSTVELSAAATEHHRIHLQHDYPIKCPIYRIPFNLRNEFIRQIADLEKTGIISKSKSQYNTPALFVKQKEKLRLVLDFRKLNEITLTQDYAIPTLNDILHEISGSNYFSALDT
ncbi:retrovirus-related Pol polyprotein from transposon 17.6 [Trichonephila clavipes]|nr:retrovirus-related Pol polyprotein from transposon 17.6 [Trichonephila clavipes]